MRPPDPPAPDRRARCSWAKGDPALVRYHDEEWGVPIHDDRRLFELLVLEGAQAGLSWLTILRKRERYREAFAHFDAARVARFDSRKIERLLRDDGIVRNRLKIVGAVRNARAFLRIQREHGSFDGFLWAFTGGRPLRAVRRRPEDVPARSTLSDTLSRELLRRDFTFVGSTICYAFLQATGVVNDHLASCFRRGDASRS
jgi:DNA-3-methyladenine glycosylase I